MKRTGLTAVETEDLSIEHMWHKYYQRKALEIRICDLEFDLLLLTSCISPKYHIKGMSAVFQLGMGPNHVIGSKSRVSQRAQFEFEVIIQSFSEKKSMEKLKSR